VASGSAKVENEAESGGKWVRKWWKMGQKAVENGSANKKKVFQVLPNGLPSGVISYIKKSEFIPRNLPTVF
jgi:hypothetical protein